MKLILTATALLFYCICNGQTRSHQSQVIGKIISVKKYRTEKVVILKVVLPIGDTKGDTIYFRNNVTVSEMSRIKDGDNILIILDRDCKPGEVVRAKIKIL